VRSRRARSRRSGCRRRRSTRGCPKPGSCSAPGSTHSSRRSTQSSPLRRPRAPRAGSRRRDRSWWPCARMVSTHFKASSARLVTSEGRRRASCSTAARRPRRPTPTRRS
jgi:hypothetical protein